MSHISFPSIEQFKTISSNLYRIKESNGLPDTLVLEGTVKLHGTNASLVLNGDIIICQSRNRILSEECDNCGFCAYINRIPKERLLEMIQKIKYKTNNKSIHANSFQKIIYRRYCKNRLCTIPECFGKYKKFSRKQSQPSLWVF